METSMLINGGKINVKKKVSKTPKKSLSKDINLFYKNLKNNPILRNCEKILKLLELIKKIKRKNIVKVVNNKDENKSKNKFTKKVKNVSKENKDI